MQKLPRWLELEMQYYIKGFTDFYVIHDLITDFIENKNIKDETKEITKICNHLTNARKWYENWKKLNANTSYELAKSYLFYLNNK